MSVLKPADPFPSIKLSMVSGDTRVLADNAGRWTLFIVYRGDHCPRCKAYVAHLHELAAAYNAREVDIVLGSMDPEPVAKRTIEQNAWTLPVAFGLSEDECRQLSMYITAHESGSEREGKNYSEPGLYLINPEGLTQVIATSNSPSVRPDLDVVLDGIIGTQDRNLPIRGLVV